MFISVPGGFRMPVRFRLDTASNSSSGWMTGVGAWTYPIEGWGFTRVAFHLSAQRQKVAYCRFNFKFHINVLQEFRALWALEAYLKAIASILEFMTINQKFVPKSNFLLDVIPFHPATLISCVLSVYAGCQHLYNLMQSYTIALQQTVTLKSLKCSVFAVFFWEMSTVW